MDELNREEMLGVEGGACGGSGLGDYTASVDDNGIVAYYSAGTTICAIGKNVLPDTIEIYQWKQSTSRCLVGCSTNQDSNINNKY